jgi:hypothetical protein
MTKKLILKSDRLGELTADDLRAVVGGIPTQVGPDSIFQCPQFPAGTPTLPVWFCATATTA